MSWFLFKEKFIKVQLVIIDFNYAKNNDKIGKVDGKIKTVEYNGKAIISKLKIFPLSQISEIMN